MTNQQIIIKLIDTDQDVYNDLLFKSYIDWCMIYAVFNIPFKVLVNNESLYNWYYKHWQSCVEDDFINDFKNDIEAVDNDPQLFMDLFKTYPAAIENFYPSVILNMIKETLKPNKINE